MKTSLLGIVGALIAVLTGGLVDSKSSSTPKTYNGILHHEGDCCSIHEYKK